MFFYLFDVWKWPEPVILTSIEIPENNSFKLDLNVWNPNLHYDDSEHIMPIITPYYPQFNTSVNVLSSTLSVIKREFHRAYLIMKEKDENLTDLVKDLYQKIDLSIDYALFLRLDIISEENQLNKWVGIIQNKLKILIISLQKVKNLTI